MADLQNYESDIYHVATVEEIDLDRKIKLVREQISTEVQEFLRRQTGVVDWKLRDVVITEPLKRWATCFSLAAIYRDAHLKQLSDRYKGKWTEYERLAMEARRSLLDTGIGRVYLPLSRPAPPVVEVSIGGPASGACYFRASFTRSDGTESEGSALVAITADAGSRVRVRLQSFESSAEGWNVYGGATEDSVTLQNSQPLGLASEWELDAWVVGRPVSEGQEPEYWTRARNLLWRG
jgi:hypothetical protein